MKVKTMTARILTSLLLGLLAAGPTLAGPICVDAGNPQYFYYGGKTIALVGTSAEYLCHVAQVQPNKPSNQVPFLGSYCMYSDPLVPVNLDYTAYIDELAAKNLNVFRVWVGLNHSPGREPDAVGQPFDPDPYPHEHPFPFNTGMNKWNAAANLADDTTWDTTYLTQLFNVINYAQGKTPSVIVEVTLFDPWSGDWTRGPWNSANVYNGTGFAAEKDFATLPAGTSCATAIASGPRKRQVDMMKRIAKKLNPLNNFYWEIANEPEINADNGVTGAEAALWHDCMVQQLYNYEATLPNGHHLIGVNYHTIDALNTIKNNTYPSSVPNVKVVNTHYVHNADGTRQGAIDLIRSWHDTSGGTDLNRIFGFNETKIVPILQTPDTARAEAWEFMLNEGGIYDHLGYEWATNTQATNLRNYLGKLNSFLGTLNLRRMNRSTGNPPSWVLPGPIVPPFNSLPPYGTPETSNSATKIYWAAMQESTDTYVLYIHHSQLHSSKTKYVKPTSINRLTSLILQPGSNLRTYTVKWINPATGVTIPSSPSSFVADGMLKQLTVPNYTYDIALSVSDGLTNAVALTCAPF